MKNKQTVFNDFENFSDLIRGWDLDFRQLDRGAFKANLSQLSTETLLITRSSFSRRLEQKGASPFGTWTFGILHPSSPEIIWRGQKFDKENIALFPPGSDLDAHSPPGFNVLTLSISENELSRWNSLQRFEFKSNKQSSNLVRKINPIILNNIRYISDQLSTEAKDKQESVHWLMQSLFENIIAAVYDSAPTRQSLPSAKRARAIKNITEYIEANLMESISLPDLCKIGSVSPRTLQYIFKDLYGCSPFNFIKFLRLNKVRQALSQKPYKKTHIYDIANRWGFWHMGQFALDYSRLFNELPSDTLKKAITYIKK